MLCRPRLLAGKLERATHSEALERALWTAMRTLKERTVLHKKMIERKRNKGEQELRNRLEESIHTAENDLKLLREILDRI